MPPRLSTAWSTKLSPNGLGVRVPGLQKPPTPKSPIPPDVTRQDTNAPLPVLATSATSDGPKVAGKPEMSCGHGPTNASGASTAQPESPPSTATPPSASIAVTNSEPPASGAPESAHVLGAGPGAAISLEATGATEEPDTEQFSAPPGPPLKDTTTGDLMATPASSDGQDDDAATDSCAVGIAHDVDAAPPSASEAVMNTPVVGTVAVGAKDVTFVGFGVAAPLVVARRAPFASDPAKIA